MTGLIATPTAATGKVVLGVYAAPGAPVNAYASNFATTADGWTAAGDGASVAWVGAQTPKAIQLSTIAPSAEVVAERNMTGLTIGAQYRVAAWLNRGNGKIAVLAAAAVGAYTATPYAVRTAVSLVFTATAATETVKFSGVPQTPGGPVQTYIDTITVQPTGTWQGTWVTRTDVNGVDVPVREDQGGQDIPNGSTSLTLTDWEAALTGPVVYTAHDGVGGTATATTTFDGLDAGVWLTAPATATPSSSADPDAVALQLVTDYSESADTAGTLHTIIGRADRIATPGPMGLRRGTVDVWAADYQAVAAVRALAASGEILLLRQPTHPGMDMYFYPQSVSARPEQADTATRRWAIGLTYEQVLPT